MGDGYGGDGYGGDGYGGDGYGRAGYADDGHADDAEERAWLRRARLADECRAAAELDERLDHLPFTLREASRAVDDMLLRLLERDGVTNLSLTSLHALVVARRGGPVASLAQRLRVSPQAAGRLVRDLVGRGLIDSATSPMDARVRLVSTTPDGEQLLRELRRQLFVAVTVVADSVGEERVLTLTDDLADLALIDATPPSSW